MNIEAKPTFLKDLAHIDQKTLFHIKTMLHDLQTKEFGEICQTYDIKKLSGYASYWRIRIGSYRVGVKIEQDTLICMRCKHRKDIYRIFP